MPGRCFGKAKPVYALTSATTFSGGEQFGYDLQQLGRVTIVGERTRGGAHAREGFSVHPHPGGNHLRRHSGQPQDRLQLGGHWRRPDIQTTAAQARDTAYQLALKEVIAVGGPESAEARNTLAAPQADTV